MAIGQAELPGFYSRRSRNTGPPTSVADEAEAARLIDAHLGLGLGSGILVCVPVRRRGASSRSRGRQSSEPRRTPGRPASSPRHTGPDRRADRRREPPLATSAPLSSRTTPASPAGSPWRSSRSSSPTGSGGPDRRSPQPAPSPAMRRQPMMFDGHLPSVRSKASPEPVVVIDSGTRAAGPVGESMSAQIVAPAIDARGIRRVYAAKPEPVTALAGVDLEVQPGELYISGPNGAREDNLIKILDAACSRAPGRPGSSASTSSATRRSADHEHGRRRRAVRLRNA